MKEIPRWLLFFKALLYFKMNRQGLVLHLRIPYSSTSKEIVLQKYNH
jgi:hypothetical protein